MTFVGDLARFFFHFNAPLWGTRMTLLLVCLTLTAFGVLFINSTTGVSTSEALTPEACSQIMKGAVALAVVLVVVALDYRFIERFSFPVYSILISVLLLLLMVKQVAPVRRWFHLGELNIQPSEPMKIALILALARFLRFRKDQRRLAGLVRPFLLTLVPMLLVVAQPDLGTSLMMPAILLGMLFVSGARRLHLFIALCAGLLLLPTMVLIDTWLPKDISGKLVKEYQAKRVESWLPWASPDDKRIRDAQHQLRHSLIAVGSGGLFGMGYGNGTQNLRKLPPARETDFIFSIIGEEWGLVGTCGVVLTYLLLVLLCFGVAIHSRDPYARLVATGVAVLFAAQGFQNFGMTLGLTPITGIPLPFVSYGGSSLVTSYLAVGLVLGIAFKPVRIMASQDLNPRDLPRAVRLIDDHPAGANRLPNGPY